ncbi:MAG: two-component sensor histidine kinase, partial [Alphaproteobacteria bacterium]|nr:two-component sensor histidine kinase [Alphaproteobacteria bacterium]
MSEIQAAAQPPRPAAPPGQPASLAARLSRFLRGRVAGRLAVALAVAATASGLATYVQLTTGQVSQNPVAILLLLYLDLVLLLALATVVARRIVQIWAQRRRGSAGAKLHV